ncbi:MAG TPA: hypothetical protein VMC61_00455 [Methanocella sp.]|nr:hypothetical protein [Methanocella sp.]
MYLRVFTIGLVAMLAMAALGCVSHPAPSPTPPPTVTPAPPKPWPPATIGVITSSQVSVDELKVSYNRGERTMQSENFSVLLTNNGRTWANNTFLTLRVSDAQTGQDYYGSPQIDVGNMSPRSSRWVNLSTGSHDYGFSVFVQVEWFWGDDLEFHNKFKKAYTLAPVDPDHVY